MRIKEITLYFKNMASPKFISKPPNGYTTIMCYRNEHMGYPSGIQVSHNFEDGTKHITTFDGSEVLCYSYVTEAEE